LAWPIYFAAHVLFGFQWSGSVGGAGDMSELYFLSRGEVSRGKPGFTVKVPSESKSSQQRTALQVQIDVIAALVLREVQSRFGRSRVGFIWALLEPIAHVVVPVVMFGFVFQRVVPGVDYPVFLLYGLLPFLLFKNVCLQTMDGAQANRGLLAYRQIHLIDVFLARAVSNVVIEVILFSIVFAGLAFLGYDVVLRNPLEVVLSLVLAVLMGLGLGMLLAAVCSFIPDARALIKIMFAPLYFVSGVLYPVSRFSTQVVEWLSWNPVLHLIDYSRLGALPHYRPIFNLNIFYPMAVAAVALWVGLSLYQLRQLNRVTM
jgi:capsular polysaccharide transport system permease protein